MSTAESFAGHGPGDVRGRGVEAERLGRDLRGDEPGDRRGHRRDPAGRSRRRAGRHRRRGQAFRRLGGADRVRPRGGAARGRRRLERRRDELARTLTLDQGKPLHAEAYDEVDELWPYWRRRAEDGKRLEGSILPNASRRASACCSCAARSGPVGVDHARGTGRTRCPPSCRARAGGRQHRGVDAGAEHGRVLGAARRVRRRGRPAARRLQLRHRPGRRWSATRSSRNPGTVAVGFIGSTATGRRIAERAAGKRLLLEMGGNGPLVVLDGADVDAAAQAAVSACFLCAGQSCTAGERLLVAEGVRDEFVERLGSAVAARRPARRPLRRRGRRWARSTTRASPRRWTSTSATRSTRGARVVAGGARSTDFPTDLYWTATDPRRRRRGRRGRTRGDVRADRPGRPDRRPRARDRARQRLALRPARRRSSPAT